MKTTVVRFWLLLLLALAASLLFPAAGLAAGESGNKWGYWFTVGRLFNLALVIFILVWIGRKPLGGFFASRTQSIRQQLADAQQARLEAEEKIVEIERRMSRIDDELEQIKATAEREAQEEYDRLVAEAERDADKIVERARQEISGMTRSAHLELKQHAAELAVRLAEERIRAEMTEKDRDRLFGRFVDQLGGRK